MLVELVTSTEASKQSRSKTTYCTIRWRLIITILRLAVVAPLNTTTLDALAVGVNVEPITGLVVGHAPGGSVAEQSQKRHGRHEGDGKILNSNAAAVSLVRGAIPAEDNGVRLLLFIG